MNRLMKMSLSILVAFAFLLSANSVALAEEFTCRGSLGAITVDNLRVPQNGSCKLNGTKVMGTIKVENGASLTASKIAVVGNIQAEGAKSVSVSGSTVGGSIQIVQGAAAKIYKVAVKGDILFDSNNRALSSTYNDVGGNVQAFQNTGGVTVSHNTIDGNLQCKENRSAPKGGNNIVHGNKEDQCARL
ncbi:MAG TPA: hypothetical protein VK897_18825 [Anaerolineales bacterium]|nr:hypothetical protein [Anaerolineales bacterium]